MAHSSNATIILGLILTIGIIFYLDEFSSVIMKTEQHKKFPFNFDSPFILRFFGNDKKKEVPYSEFTQLLEVSACQWCYGISKQIEYSHKIQLTKPQPEHTVHVFHSLDQD